MESSTVLAFRIFVMLSCLIIVPMAAIFGSAFPDVVKTVLVDRLVAWSTGKPLESSHASSQTNGFSQLSPGAGAAPRGGTQWEAPRWGGDTAAWQAPPGGAQSAVLAAGSDAGHGVAPAYGQVRPPNDDGTRQAPAELTAVSHQTATAPPQVQLPPEANATSNQPPAALPEQPDRFTAMERKLREYGAIYYLLETWGNEGELYRFHCRMSMANNPNYTRHFEATDRDALKAMAQVLSKVEAWRAGRLQ